MLTPKQSVRKAFEAVEKRRPPFIPWVFAHAARLEHMPLRRMYSDPTQYTRCLQNAQKLYGYDAVISGFDPSLELEVCGSPVVWRGEYETPVTAPAKTFDLDRLKNINVEAAAKTGRSGTVIESLRRIKRVSGQSLATVAVLTGPLTLAAGLTGRDPIKDLTERPEESLRVLEAAAGFLLKLVQVYCQVEPDIIAFTDRSIASGPAAQISMLKPVLSPVLNVIRFYNAFSVLLPGDVVPENTGNLIDLGFDGIVAAGVDINIWNNVRSGRRCVLGKAIPARILNSTPPEIQAYLDSFIKDQDGPGVFITTDWEVPPEMPPDNMHLVMKVLGKQQGGGNEHGADITGQAGSYQAGH
ncbi:MAG: hypothetical protein A2Z29_07645 [Chloroflexi bacterium RBG_16_56_11]|nr:MAG: hypothetical protein A2Z29_07645 [Chloroflexi bacterium RBG_16_56_11]